MSHGGATLASRRRFGGAAPRNKLTDSYRGERPADLAAWEIVEIKKKSVKGNWQQQTALSASVFSHMA